MTTITSGYAIFARTVKTGEFENKKAEARLDFTVADGDDYVAIFDRAAQGAHAQVHAMLGITKKGDTAAKLEVVGDPGSRNATANDKDKLAAEKTGGKPAEVVTEGKPATTKKREPKAPPKPATDPAAMDVVSDPPKAAAAEMSEADLLGIPSEPVKPITDGVLYDEIKKKNAEIMQPVVIRKVIDSYAGALPKQAKDIPQEKRQAFLDELRALKKEAA